MITCYFDLPVLDWIARHLWCPFLDGVMPVVTHLADGGILWIALAVVLLCWPRYRKTGIAMGLALLMGIKEGMKIPLRAILGTHDLGNGIRYFCITLFAGCIWPLSFRALNKLSARKAQTVQK